MNAAITGAVTGGLALAGVIVGAWLGARNSGRHWTRETRLRACQAMMREYGSVYDWLARIASSQNPPPIDWAPWNHALTDVSFVCEPDVVEKAYALGEEIWRADRVVRHQGAGLDAWIVARVPVEEARAAFIFAVRQQLDRRLRKPVRTTGRPPQDDPMWPREAASEPEKAEG